MAKSLLYRLFGIGGIPKPLSDTLRVEGIVASDEGIPGSVTYRDFRAPGKSFSWKKQGFVGSVVITKVRLVALMYSRFAVNVPYTDERIRKLQISADAERLLVALDARVFHDDWSGTIEYRFRTSQATDMVKWIRELTQT